MLIESPHHVGFILGMLDGVFKAPSAAEISHIILRWLHFVAGVTWIGLLYFFNLVNVPLQKKLDAGMTVLVMSGALSEITLQFRMTVSLKRSHGRSPHRTNIAKLSVPNSGPISGRKITPNTKV